MCGERYNTQKKIDSTHTRGWREIKSCRPIFNNYFILFIDCKYGDPYIWEIKATRDKIHNYLGTRFNYPEKGKFKIYMRDYVNQNID